MKKILWAVTFWLLPFSVLLAQKYDYHWTFGDSAGIDFSDISNPRSILSYCNGRESSAESQLAISDTNGKMIAYITYKLESNLFSGFIRDIENNVIKNGNGLLLHPYFGTFIFIPSYDSSEYYIFNIDYRRIDGQTRCDSIACVLYRHTLSVLPDGTLEVTEKNKVILEGSFSNHLAVIRHANGRDWWLMAHESTSNRFIRFIVSPNGITLPKYQAIGRGPTLKDLQKSYLYEYGEIAFSPQGNWLGISARAIDLLELYKFNRCTGLVSDLVVLGATQKVDEKIYTAYTYPGIAFSLDESKLYVSKKDYLDWREPTFLLQYDLSKSKDSLVKPIIIHKNFNEINNFEAGLLKLAPDGKIYLALGHQKYLSVIHEPNEKYPECQFVEQGFPLQYGKSSYGLPSFPVFRVDPLPIPGARIEVTLPDCPEYERVIGQEDGRTYLWEDGSSEPLRLVPFSTQPQKYIRWAYNLYDPECAVRCDTFIVSFKRTHFIFSTGEKKSLCTGDSLIIGSLVNKCDTCYYRWLPTQGLTDPNGLQTIAQPVKSTSYIRSTFLKNGCLIGSDTVHITVIEKDVPPCTTVSRSEMVGKTSFTFFPNPANQEVSIYYAVPIEECATMEAFTATGARIAEWKLKGGRGQITLDTKAWSEGVYLFRFNCNGQIYTHKLIIAH